MYHWEGETWLRIYKEQLIHTRKSVQDEKLFGKMSLRSRPAFQSENVPSFVELGSFLATGCFHVLLRTQDFSVKRPTGQMEGFDFWASGKGRSLDSPFLFLLLLLRL